MSERYGVQPSAELQRILALPRRTWTDEAAEALADRLTAALKTPAGTMRLLPVQAIALAEIGLYRGAFVPIPTGGGKTLVQFLAGRMLPCLRPLGLMPAHLIEDKQVELREYRRHWNIPALLTLQSYQALSRVGQKDYLDTYKPDLIIPDEGHYLANTSAACTRRVMRYLHTRRVPFVLLTGTPTDTTLRQFAHLLFACLGRNAPIPGTHLDLDEWCRALDLNVVEHRRLDPGALDALRSPGDAWADIRTVYRKRLASTPGVIMYQPEEIPTPIEIRSHVLPLCEAQAKAFAELRKDYRTPDGLLCRDGVEVWRHARELSMGFYSVWTPRAPSDWRDARSAWASECRSVISGNRREIDTEDALVRHMAANPTHYPETAEILAAWRAIEPSFTPNPVPVWISDKPLEWVASWAAEGPGLIWTDRPAIGHRLSEKYGIPYYGLGGIDARTGRSVTSHKPAEGACVVGRKSNDSGRNLQAFARSLVIDIPKSGKDWQQLIARTHRRGQLAGAVTVDAHEGSIEDITAFWAACDRGEHASLLFGHTQKLLTADKSGVIQMPPLHEDGQPRWKKTK